MHDDSTTGLVCAIIMVIGLVHLYLFLLSKGIIFVALHLFELSWRGEFWAVYVLSLLLMSLSGNLSHKGSK